LSLFTAPPMKPNIGWNATSTPAAAASTRCVGSSSRTSRNAHAAVIAAYSADRNRAAVTWSHTEPPVAT
jgi:hypothetical protein